MELIDANAEDVEVDEGFVNVTSSMEDFGNVQKKLEDLGIETEEAGLQRIPTTSKEISADTYKTVLKIFDMLDDDEDVTSYYHNIEFNEELAQIEL
jgi:transcriptional/translational regulatory protein YebC/TACO1